MNNLAATWRSNILHRLQYLPKRCYRTTPVKAVHDPNRSKTELPDTAEEWRAAFPSPSLVSHRCSVRDSKAAAQIANAFVPKGSKGKVIVEAFPGPGSLTRAFMQLPKSRVKKIIVLEDWANYLEYLKPLEEIDPRVQVVPLSGHHWTTYQQLQETTLADIPTMPWESGIHPSLTFVSHIPSTVLGEQLVAQLYRQMGYRNWLFSYGRVPMHFVMQHHMFNRLTAQGTSVARCKASVVADATSTTELAVPFEDLQPFADLFHPKPVLNADDVRSKTRSVGAPFCAVNVFPLEKIHIQEGSMDKWDFILRRIFVRKASPVGDVIPSLAPGAKILLKMVSDPSKPENERIDLRKQVRTMSPNDWAILVKAFDEWPFAPEELGINDGFGEDKNRH